MQAVTKTWYPTLAAALGAWFAGEVTAAQARPDLMCAAEGGPSNAMRFGGAAFDDHLQGMVGDLIDICDHANGEPGPRFLCIAKRVPANLDAQRCLQGWVHFERG